ncbi:MAG: sulfotransferase [Halioglobus sp.]
MSRRMLYVVGAPRSGSKLLRELLNRHSRIVFTTHETEFLPFLLKFQRDHALTSPAVFQRLVDYLKLEDYCFFRRLDGFEAPDWQAWFKRLSAASGGAEAFTALLEQELQLADDSIILGDKSPSYVFHLDDVLTQFPDACVVHLVRDPRAQAGSEKRVFGKSPRVSGSRWQRAVDCVVDARARFPGRVMELRYEDLVSDPEKALTPVCEVLGLRFEHAMTRIDRELERYRKHGDAPAIHRPDAEVYLRDLSIAEVTDVCRICATGMQRYGYAPGLDSPVAASAQVVDRDQGSVAGRLRFAALTVYRHGPAALLRKVRLKRARARIMAGNW